MSDDAPLVSVVTIVRNDRAGFLSTLDSVRAQRGFEDVEHIVVDGASRDGTAEAVCAHAAGLARWVSEPDAGISDAFNKALALASGRWINFLNAGDTYADQGVLARVAPLLRADRHAIVTGYSVTAGVRSPPYPVGNHERLARRAWISHQGSFIHRRVFESCGGFDLRFRVRMDYELWLRALPRFPFLFVDGAAGHLRARRCQHALAARVLRRGVRRQPDASSSSGGRQSSRRGARAPSRRPARHAPVRALPGPSLAIGRAIVAIRPAQRMATMNRRGNENRRLPSARGG